MSRCQLLIPVSSVHKVSQEKTAKFIPNAVGVATTSGKHVFASLMSRDATYQLMVSVFKKINPLKETDSVDGERVRYNVQAVFIYN